jgi:cohesin complex subunit SCC1
MFYGHFFLGKKGPLAQIWLVAHLERKLSRQQVFDTDIGSAIDQVITPKVTFLNNSPIQLNSALLG